MSRRSVDSQPIKSEADAAGYLPRTLADWTDPDPNTVQQALDDLAGASGAGTGARTYTAVSTPSTPSVGSGVLFARTSGNNIELIFMSATGEECVICTNVNVAHVNALPLNWIE